MRAMRSVVIGAAVLSAAVQGCGGDVAPDVSSARSAASGEWAWSAPVRIPEKTPGTVNSAAAENNPSLSADGRTLFFVRRASEIWMSRWDESARAWDDPVALAPCITMGPRAVGSPADPSDNAPSLSADGQRLFFSSDRDAGAQAGNFDLFAARRTEDLSNGCGGWEEPVPLSSLVNTPARETGPEPVQASEGGEETLYFGRQELTAATPPVSVFRIWVAPMAHDGTVLGEPRLVPELSPTGDPHWGALGAPAIGPSVRVDGREIFFHTTAVARDAQGNVSLLPADILTATRDDPGGPWSAPVSVGAPLNSPQGDAQPNLSRDGRTLFFISNRPGSAAGSTDIWMSTRSPRAP